jgi:DNA repair exonuclease SbcCD ATPase subunit
MVNQTTIRSLRVENFGCFRDQTIKFNSGTNQIIGPNESGKSTIIRALFTVLFEDGSTKKKPIGALANWSAKQSFRLTLEFSVGDKIFTLIRDYNSGRDIMTDSDGITYEGKVIGEKLAVYFGTSDRALFESVFCVSSDNPTAPESSKERLQSAIEIPAFYGFDRGRADRQLEEEIKKLENPRAHGPRELDMIGEQISARLQEKLELDKRMDALNKEEQERDDVRQKLKEHEVAMERLEKEVEGAAAYQELDGRMVNLEDRLQVHLANFSKAVQVAEDLTRVEQELNRLQPPGIEEMAAISQKGEEITSRVDESKQNMDAQIVRRKKANRGFAMATLGLVLLCLAYVILQNGFIESGPVADILPYTIPVMALVWLARMGVYLVHFRIKKKATIDFREQVANLDEFYSQLNKDYVLKAADPVRALEEAVQRRDALEISAENLRNTIDVLSENKGLESLTKTREIIEGEVAQLNQELAPVAQFAAAAGKMADLKEELIARRVRSNALRERAALLAERCTAVAPLQESITKIEDGIEILKRKHKEVTDRLEIMKITRLALNRAADQLIEDTFEAYSASSSTYLDSLTDGRFNQLRFNRENSRFEAKMGDTGRWSEISDTLSSSTRDCIYLALRLAGVGLLSAEFAPPIILDQADTRMDNSRREGFYNLLNHAVEKRQVIYIGLEKIDRLAESHLLEFEKAVPHLQPTGQA